VELTEEQQALSGRDLEEAMQAADFQVRGPRGRRGRV
jgi:hypothetical protein